jgi:prolyl 4-hydroxylase
MQQALRKWEEEAADKKTVDKADVIEYLSFSLYAQGNMRRALRLTNELLELRPDHPRAYGNKVYYEGALKKEGGSVDLKKRGEHWLRNFLLVPRGQLSA